MKTAEEQVLSKESFERKAGVMRGKPTLRGD